MAELTESWFAFHLKKQWKKLTSWPGPCWSLWDSGFWWWDCTPWGQNNLTKLPHNDMMAWGPSRGSRLAIRIMHKCTYPFVYDHLSSDCHPFPGGFLLTFKILLLFANENRSAVTSPYWSVPFFKQGLIRTSKPWSGKVIAPPSYYFSSSAPIRPGCWLMSEFYQLRFLL